VKLTVVITVFNERETIAEAVAQARDLPIEKQIVIVDNCSTDGTVDILKGLADDSMEIVFQPRNLGFGTSVARGIDLARGEYSYVHYTDLEYDPRCVFDMIELADREGLDAVFGSRLLNRKGESAFALVRERPFYLGTIVTTRLTNLFYGTDFTDIIGAKFYRTESFRALRPTNLTGIGFDWEVISKLCKYGCRVREVPVRYTPRTKGKRKIHAYDIIPAIATICRWRLFG
jgi:glycosyltransferase involved in cell wall biosynthesis